MSGTITLFCWAIGTRIDQIFSVKILQNNIWGTVKGVIKEEKKPDFDDIAADALDLWKVTIDRSQLQFHLGSEEYLKKVMATETLDPIDYLSTEFKDSLPDDQINIIIIQRPTYSSNLNRSFIVDAHWSPRTDTVGRLFDILQRERFVHVRGGPGSGKTTLKELLHAHIVEEMPHARVHVVDSWPPSNAPARASLKSKLKLIDPTYPNQDTLKFLLFDEGQDTYKDQLLWNAFFKRVHDGLCHYHVILFCSYGSPSASPLNYTKGTPPVLHPAARVSLWNDNHYIGLLLNPTEFNEVVAGYAKKSERKLLLDPELQDHFYVLTGGHVGAVVALLQLVSYQRVKEMQEGEAFTVANFNEENPTHSLVQRLHTGAFGRGLVQERFQEFPQISAFLRDLIRHTPLKWEDVADKEAAEICHHRGWIHSYMDEKGHEYYTFSSPLHSVITSWSLKPSDDMPKYPTTFELCFSVLSYFKPSQMRIPIRRVGAPGVLSPLPEVQYKDEFYRSLLSVTAGNVCISPEFASAKGADVVGRIDFFIPEVKWGIEITRDGNRLSDYNSLFEDLGAYEAWLRSGDMADYILLDCRTHVPRKHHRNIQNLFHAVFSKDYQTVTLYDNQAQKVGESIGLRLENHL